MRTEYTENQRLLDMKIEQTQEDLMGALRQIARMNSEIANKVDRLQKHGVSAGFNEDLNIGAAGAKIQALTAQLAILVGIRNGQDATHEWFAPKDWGDSGDGVR